MNYSPTIISLEIPVTVTKHSTEWCLRWFLALRWLVFDVLCVIFLYEDCFRMIRYSFTYKNVINKRVICFKSASRLEMTLFFPQIQQFMCISRAFVVCLFRSRNVTKRSTAKNYYHFHSVANTIGWKRKFSELNTKSDGTNLLQL